MKVNPWIKVGAGLAVGARLGQLLMATVETVADKWLTKKSDELQAKIDAREKSEEVTE